MAGVPEADEAPEGVGGIRSVLTIGSLVSPSGNEVLFSVSSCSSFSASALSLQHLLSGSGSCLAFAFQ